MPHAQITCVQCHVTPGVGGWVESKMAGTRQLMEVVFNTHQRPIPSALETNRLVPSNETCEQCHWRELPGSVRLRVISKFAEDEANTPTQTVLTVLVGGRQSGGIHGSHMGPGSRSDTRPRTRSGRSSRGSSTRTARKASRAPTSRRRRRPRRWRPCRSTRCSASIATIVPPTRSIRPRGGGQGPRGGPVALVPPLHKEEERRSLEGELREQRRGRPEDPAALDEYYKQAHPASTRTARRTSRAPDSPWPRLYARNVFPDLKVTWEPIRTTSGTTPFPAASAATTRATRRAGQDDHAGLRGLS
jgi:hypothetical protein